MAPLIPKKENGYRDIVLFPGLTRMCMKARVPDCRRWEHEHERNYFASGSARAAPDVVWRTSVRAAAAVAKGQQAAAVLWDVSSFFQMLRHRRLLTRAALSGFPMPLARLAVRLYRSERRLCLGRDIATEGVRPDRGIAPGCHLATTLVKVYCLLPFDGVARRHPEVDLDIYIDDLQISARGEPEQVEDKVCEAAADLREVVQLEIVANLAEAKAAVVASSGALAGAIRRRLGKDGGTDKETTVALGIDFASGRKTRRGGRLGRLARRVREVAGRRVRIRQLAKAARGGRLIQKIIKSGVVPTALYGAAVTGVPDDMLLNLRRTAAAAAVPRAQGRSLDVALRLSGLEVTAAATAPPLVRWAQ
jgi:hypothetical protein